MKNLSGKGYYLSKRIGKAIADYDMIQDADKILIAVSGGKDSLTMLELLAERRRWAPVHFDIVAAHIRSDFKCGSCIHQKTLEDIFTRIGCDYHFGDIKVLHTGKTPGEVSCFWCSWNRRKELFQMAARLGCNKIAFGHHLDDVIETTLLNLFFNGEISTMNPKQELFDGQITIIRPLVYIEERYISAYAKEQNFPCHLCACPNSVDSNRKLMKKIIAEVGKVSPHLKRNIFTSPRRIRDAYLGKVAADTHCMKKENG